MDVVLLVFLFYYGLFKEEGEGGSSNFHQVGNIKGDIFVTFGYFEGWFWLIGWQHKFCFDIQRMKRQDKVIAYGIRLEKMRVKENLFYMSTCVERFLCIIESWLYQIIILLGYGHFIWCANLSCAFYHLTVISIFQSYKQYQPSYIWFDTKFM